MWATSVASEQGIQLPSPSVHLYSLERNFVQIISYHMLTLKDAVAIIALLPSTRDIKLNGSAKTAKCTYVTLASMKTVSYVITSSLDYTKNNLHHHKHTSLTNETLNLLTL